MLNEMCKDCECLGVSCDGTQETAWTGCIYKKPKFELFGGCLGNGTTVCNKAVMENGDYKTIAHISNGGRIKWYIKNPKSYVPAADMKIIQGWADSAREKFMEEWNRLPDTKKYGRIIAKIGFLPHLNVDEATKNQLRACTDLHEKVALLEKIYFEYI